MENLDFTFGEVIAGEDLKSELRDKIILAANKDLDEGDRIIAGLSVMSELVVQAANICANAQIQGVAVTLDRSQLDYLLQLIRRETGNTSSELLPYGATGYCPTSIDNTDTTRYAGEHRVSQLDEAAIKGIFKIS